ncbi:helix-turn-helix domain-containing protein [Salibacterium aidingense]|uniref:helix-turn-helix domain-containing protein n=1 Tax=Salibacterium aidingense TaxID=384933 RepID=UPI00047EA8FA|nr:helix-turn-helix transcriptional regulator [Salibacterium aidingense]
MLNKVGQRARQIRINKGIKQSYVANKLGYRSPSSLNDIEKGRRHLKADKIPILAKALGVEVDDLFFDNKVRETRTKSTSA